MTPPRVVNDFSQVLSVSERDELEQKILAYNDTSSIEIAIVTVNSLEGMEVAQYAIGLFNEWKIGKQGKNNGVLILACMPEKKMFIVTGYGLEGAITDAMASRIYRNVMAPAFREGRYYEGFDAAVDRLIELSRGEYTNDEKDKESSDNEGPFGILFVFIIIVVIISIISGGNRNKNNRGGGGNYMSRRGSDIITGALLNELLRGGRSGGFGGGSRGGFGGGGFGGGGFGGFGGGLSGGGGAGGSW